MLVVYGVLVAAGAVILFRVFQKKEKLSGRRGQCLLILWGFCILAFVLRCSVVLEERDAGRTEISRNAFEEGSKEVYLKALHGEETDEISLRVEPRSYTGQETEALYERFIPALEQILLGENESLDEVRSPLSLIHKADGFPFLVEWECDGDGVVRLDGTLDNEALHENGKVVNLRARISYEVFLREYEFALRVMPPVYTAAEQFRRKLESAVKKAEAEEKSLAVFSLPEQVDGVSIVWKEAVEDKSTVCLLLGAVITILYWKSGEEKERKRQEEREKALRNAYPEFVTRMALMMGAGMTVRAAFRKLSEGNGTPALIEEMQITCHEMDSGISEGQAYIRFGQRCRLKQYRKLGTLLTQNLKKGSKGLLAELEKEAHEALEEKKSNARALGEEAGTKLLLPMIGLLVISMMIIIVPAYGNFGL